MHNPRRQTFPKWVAGTLPDPVDLLRGGPHDDAKRIVTNEYLILEGTKSATGLVHAKSGNGTPHFDVRKQYCRRHEFFDALLFDTNSRLRVWFDRWSLQSLGEGIPVVTGRMPQETARLEMFQ